ncbi:MAG: transcriptional repressor [Deltaproteobacteria bacterium]|nr:transcriptional repressor [Deltaproteobacteria bacterium]
MKKETIPAKMEVFNAALERQGLKSTRQRYDIADMFFMTTTHVSLEELLRKVRRKNPGVGYATVYRTMKLLAGCELALERQFGDGQTRYENVPEDGHHDHMICLRCSGIEEFHNRKIEGLQSAVARRLGFKVVRHKLELYGYCKDCV